MIVSWLILGSIIFYSFWKVKYLITLFFSIFINYFIGMALVKCPEKHRKKALIIGISFNILLLIYYKYYYFLINIFANLLNPLTFSSENMAIPLGISFFTFTQIAFLVDVYQQKCQEYSITDYCLFVTYFPHLIAGPILHHQEMMPQFKKIINYKFNWDNLSLGISLFAIGLFKKVVIADYFVCEVQNAFNAATTIQITFLEAWYGAIGYALQIYFDFSGYCDMAIGLSKMFGIKLPINFNSPYKATSIIDFWHRWHITLGRFLRNYVYIPFGGSKVGFIRKYFNLFLTMLLGGIWHGAGYTFILWGIVHGVLLSINHFIKDFGFSFKYNEIKKLLIFIIVVLTWVPFRALNLETTFNIWKGCLGLNGITLPSCLYNTISNIGTNMGKILELVGVKAIPMNPHLSLKACLIMFVVLLITFYAPNSIEIFKNYENQLFLLSNNSSYTYLNKDNKISLQWYPSVKWAIALTIILILGIWCRQQTTEFLYFQF